MRRASSSAPALSTRNETEQFGSRDGRPFDIRSEMLNIFLLILLAVLISGLGAYRAPSLSAYDEATHIDYVWAVQEGRIPAAGSELAPDVLEEWACRSQDNAREALPECGDGAATEARDFPNRGENYNFGHPPLYYALTALAVRTFDATPFDLSFVTVARLTGAAWLGAALVGLYVLLRQWGLPPAYGLASSALLAAVPSVAHASSTVTNDAPAALAGVLALSVLTRLVLRQNLGWLVPTLLALAVTATKVITSVAFLAIAGVAVGLAIRSFRRARRAEGWRLIAVAAGISVSVFVVFAGWRRFQAGRGDDDWVSPIRGINTAPVDGGPLDEWFPTLFSVFGISGDFWLQATLTSAYVIGIARLLSILLSAAPFMNVAAFDRGDVRTLPAYAFLLGVIAVPIAVQVQTYIGSESYFPHVSGRYGVSLLPFAISALGLVMAKKGWRVQLALISTASVGVLLLSFAGLL